MLLPTLLYMQVDLYFNSDTEIVVDFHSMSVMVLTQLKRLFKREVLMAFMDHSWRTFSVINSFLLQLRSQRETSKASAVISCCLHIWCIVIMYMKQL